MRLRENPSSGFLFASAAALSMAAAGCATPQTDEVVMETPPREAASPSVATPSVPEAIPDGFPTAAVAALRDRLSQCWRAPMDAPDPGSLVVGVQARLDIDGRLREEPVVLPGPGGRDESDPHYRSAVHLALRAVRDCQPYDFLPKDRYDEWETIVFTFMP